MPSSIIIHTATNWRVETSPRIVTPPCPVQLAFEMQQQQLYPVYAIVVHRRTKYIIEWATVSRWTLDPTRVISMVALQNTAECTSTWTHGNSGDTIQRWSKLHTAPDEKLPQYLNSQIWFPVKTNNLWDNTVTTNEGLKTQEIKGKGDKVLHDDLTGTNIFNTALEASLLFSVDSQKLLTETWPKYFWLPHVARSKIYATVSSLTCTESEMFWTYPSSILRRQSIQCQTI